MNTQKTIATMIGFKATDNDMTCLSHKFELGKWYEVTGDLVECKNGFHFCEQKAGVFSYYGEKNSRIFEIEAEDILDTRKQSGTNYKRVCRRIRLTREEFFIGNSNTGNSNTGDWNTGNRNTGDWNTGNRNTGNSNTGDWNTGDWNATNFSSGFFCDEELDVISFNVQTKYSRLEFLLKFPECVNLGNLLFEQSPIDFEQFKNIPGITQEKLTRLHNKILKK